MHYRQIVEKALQELVNEKHLYQSVTVDFEPCVKKEAREIYIRRREPDGPGMIRLPIPYESEEEIKKSLLEELDSKD
jgi:hypothetical protein